MVTEIHWENDDWASQALVDAILDDIDRFDPQVRAAARKFALQHVEESDGLKMGDWQHSVGCFALGYKTALQDNHLL